MNFPLYLKLLDPGLLLSDDCPLDADEEAEPDRDVSRATKKSWGANPTGRVYEMVLAWVLTL